MSFSVDGFFAIRKIFDEICQTRQERVPTLYHTNHVGFS